MIGLGMERTDLKDNQGAKAALKALTIPMEKRDISIKGNKTSLERFQAVTRMDTGEVMSIVSPAYRLVPHHEALSPILEALEQGGWQFKRVSIERGGAHAYVEAVLKDLNLMEGTKEVVYPKLTWSNSVDLRGSIKAVFGAFRQVCSNGMVVADPRFGTLKFRSVHMGDVDGKLDKLNGKLKEKLTWLKEVGQMYKGLMNQKVDQQTAEAMLNRVVGKRQIERVLDLWKSAPGQPEKWETKWGLYNGLTYWLTHEAKGGVYVRDLKSQKMLRALLANRS